MKLSVYNSDNYNNYSEADAEGALHNIDYYIFCYSHHELAYYIKKAVDIVEASVGMMDSSKPFNCAYETSNFVVIDDLRNKSIDEIAESLQYIAEHN